MSTEPPPLNIVTPVTLEGPVVRLEPIAMQHAESFWSIAKNDAEKIFQWIPYRMKTPTTFATS